MSESTTSTSSASGPAAKRLPAGKQAGELIFALLLLLAALGIGVTDLSANNGFWYWSVMVPVFGAVNLFAGWSSARRQGKAPAVVVRTQILHWTGTFVAIQMLFILVNRGRFTNADIGLTALMLLSLSTFLAGVHSDWRFMFVGALLALSAAGAAFVEQMLWMALIPAIGIVVLVIYWSRKAAGRVKEEVESFGEKLDG